MDDVNILLACFETPADPLPSNAVLLSFLSPAKESELHTRLPNRVISARTIIPKIQDQARHWYAEVVARLGAVQMPDGQTLREALRVTGRVSSWWFHPVSGKNCEYDLAYNHFLYLFSILHVAKETHARRIKVIGGPDCLADVLAKSGYGEEPVPALPRALRLAKTVGRALCHRFFKGLREALLVLFATTIPKNTAVGEVLLAAYWDWSFSRDSHTGLYRDRYLTDLGARFQSKGKAVSWIAWLDPRNKTWKKILSRDYRSVSPGIIVLQCFLSLADIGRVLFNFRPLRVYAQAARIPAFMHAFIIMGIDVFPLFSQQLLHGFLDWSIAHGELVLCSIQRMSQEHRCRMLITFQEHFLHSRALYAGMMTGDDSVHICTVQHASYCRHKTFLFLDPDREFAGAPDGLAVPHPDLVFAIGRHGATLFSQCGYPSHQIVTTGSPRYDQTIRLEPAQPPEPRQNGPFVVLLACSLELRAELDMVEAAVLAVQGLEGVELRLRSHPDKKVEHHPRFSPLAKHVRVSNQGLLQDIREAHVLLFTQTTVAEEAYIQGKPVWQWLPLGYNGSALVEVADIPQFHSVESLHETFKVARSDPDTLAPSPGQRREVLEQLFFSEDGLASQRICDYCITLLSHNR